MNDYSMSMMWLFLSSELFIMVPSTHITVDNLDMQEWKFHSYWNGFKPIRIRAEWGVMNYVYQNVMSWIRLAQYITQ